MNKGLSRIPRGAKIGGVCGGIADYYGLSRTGLRLAALLALFMFPVTAFCSYMLLMFVLPSSPTHW